MFANSNSAWALGGFLRILDSDGRYFLGVIGPLPAFRIRLPAPLSGTAREFNQIGYQSEFRQMLALPTGRGPFRSHLDADNCGTDHP